MRCRVDYANQVLAEASSSVRHDIAFDIFRHVTSVEGDAATLDYKIKKARSKIRLFIKARSPLRWAGHVTCDSAHRDTG
jgi:hypothetical protein